LKQAAIDATGSAVVDYQGTPLDFGNVRRNDHAGVTSRSWRRCVRSRGLDLVHAFENRIEPTLIQPTIIYEYPVEVSPLSKNNRGRPGVRRSIRDFTRRGWRSATRTRSSTIRRSSGGDLRCNWPCAKLGDEEAHQMDEDYLRAMSYGNAADGWRGNRD